MHSRIMNKSYSLGGQHAALQAGAWSYGRRGSGKGRQEGACPLRGGPQMKPHNRKRRTRGRSKAGTATSSRECFARFAMPSLPLQCLQ